MFKDIVDFKSIQIRLSSAEEIKSRSFGEITKPETINYRTLKPEKDGLFCERIFGPTKDWECFCGKYKKMRYRGVICDKCGVEVTRSSVRRERLGHIVLASPVVHIWYFKSPSSPLSLLLDLSPKLLQGVIYLARYLVTAIDEEKRKSALKQLRENFEEAKKGLRGNYQQRIKTEEGREKSERARLAETVKDKERRSLAVSELELGIREEIQRLKEELSKEEESLTKTQEDLYERARNLGFLSTLSEDERSRLVEYGADSFFKVGMGAEALDEVIEKIDLDKLIKELKKEAEGASGAKHLKATKRLRLVSGMKKAGVSPRWMILRFLPVIPPDLRPVVQLSGGRFATSDLNDLYRRVINRSNRLKHLMELGAPEIILRNEKRMLQEAVDNLIDSAKGGTSTRRTRTPALRSLSDMLRGKQGRFRQNLLGKRVDYSGRSVIVVGPELTLDQCGLPKKMALEMFKPYVLREMILLGIAPNVKSAKNILEREPPEVFEILEKITRDHPVLLNRAPTLHKLGIQAFLPILVEGAAIRIHPCICPGFGADFDGDQMAVHIPLSENASQEARELMMARNNLLKPADGSPISIPNTKEMALGVYFLTSEEGKPPAEEKVLASLDEAIFAFQTRNIGLRRLISVRIGERLVRTTAGRIIFNEVLPPALRFVNEPVNGSMLKTLFDKAFKILDQDGIVKLIDNIKNLGFWAGTRSGVSLSVFDCKFSLEKQKIVKGAENQIAEIERNFEKGLVTIEEKRRLSNDVWLETAENLLEKTWEEYEPENPVRILIEGKVGRISKNQLKQISAMRGLVTDPLGKIVPLPTKSNFREGLSSFEFVTGARGSRKGLIDTALKTADAGYLTRRLVDVAHEAIIREEDCKTAEGIEILQAGSGGKSFSSRIIGRILAKEVISPKTKKVILKKGKEINSEALVLIEDEKVESVLVRSPLTCRTKFGLCQACYGWDLSTKKMVEIGTPAGILAAQSIGEPGTQLTLKTKHTGGAVGLDITQGLPRVEELFEVRTPKIVSPLAGITGKVEINETEDGFRLKIRSKDKELAYLVPPMATLKVEDGEIVNVGAQLISGPMDIREMMELRGLLAAQRYLADEIGAVYESQGIPINERHFEVIIKMMSEKVRIIDPGATQLLPGELIDKRKFDEENRKVSGKKAQAAQVILGISRASLLTDSWLSAASFENTTNVLTDAAIFGQEDSLRGLKENVIIGRPIPTSPERARLSH